MRKSPVYLSTILSYKGLRRVAPQLAQLKRNSIQIYNTLVEDEATLPIGTSKFGGLPDLPPEMKWFSREFKNPTFNFSSINEASNYQDILIDNKLPMAFLAQLNLAEIAPYDRDNLLPKSGILYFFFARIMYLYKAGLWKHDESYNSRNCVVYHYDGDLSLLKRMDYPVNLPEEERHQACSLKFKVQETLPDIESAFIQDRGSKKGVVVLTEQEWETYVELLIEWKNRRAKKNHRSIHHLLGHANNNQPYSGGVDPKTRLLLQLDGDYINNFDFGRDGRVFFLLDDDELKNRQWQNVYFMEQ
jgi:uncharacterized protein YwqG